jgi:hypothetical protein
VTDVVADNVLHKQNRQQDAHYRIKQQQIICLAHIHIARKSGLDKMNQLLKYDGRRCRTDPDQETDKQDKVFFLYPLFSPYQEFVE